MRVVVAFLWAMAWAVWALEEGGVGSLYDQHFPPLHPNCTQSLTDLLLLRQELQLRELKEVEQVSAEILKEILTDIRSFLTRNRTSTASCPSNFRKFGETCLYLHKDTDLTWEGARLFCQNLGGDLAVFRDANALAEALAYTKGSGLSSSANVWAGGSDIAVEGEWKWVTGEDMPRGTPFWGDFNYIREPVGAPGENCAILHGPDGFLMHDAPCTWKCKPLCQIKQIKH
ncbi:hemolymph lipopolysaccharide-binding protein-like isoform X2 [Penaeus monodon]|uniref:hemolymph lipopolysaccharide-binding protein-like isoform X2 n=1 Tax=Penaeus monodon TaxID=6687 RepID=UPI0018A77C11|nr:hemolymph lipopolysaccharide-binding protein-like isoform X2 [Penaeus monodon]